MVDSGSCSIPLSFRIAHWVGYIVPKIWDILNGTFGWKSEKEEHFEINILQHQCDIIRRVDWFGMPNFMLNRNSIFSELFFLFFYYSINLPLQESFFLVLWFFFLVWNWIDFCLQLIQKSHRCNLNCCCWLFSEYSYQASHASVFQISGLDK